MRRLLATILAATMLFLLCSCTKQPSAPPEITQPTQTIAPSVSNEDVEYEQKPMYAVSLIPQIKETADDNGQIRFSHAYTDISLVLPEPEVADRILLDYLRRMDQMDQYAANICADSLSDIYDNHPYLPLFYRIEYAPSRFDTSILSFAVTEIIYLGGIHPDQVGSSVTYDLLSGEVLKLSDILQDGVSTESITQAVIADLAGRDNLWTDFNQTVEDLFKVGLEKYEGWYFSESGLCFRFDPYIISAYSEGPITVTLPYSKLTGILRDEYFPAEQDTCKGTLVVEDFTVDAQAKFTQFSEVVLVDGGTKILLSASGAITNITIQAVTTTSGNDLSEKTVMAVQSLTPGDAIMIEFDPATTLLVNYRNGDQHETKTITCDQERISIS